MIPHDKLYYVYGFWGYMVFQVLHLKDLDLWDSQYYLNCPVILSGGINQPFIEQHNSVVGYFKSDWDGIPLPTERNGQGGFSAGPYMNNTVHFPKAGFYRNTDFHYQKESLMDYAGAYPALEKLLNHFEKKDFHRISGYADLKGDPNILLRSILRPVLQKRNIHEFTKPESRRILINILEQLDNHKTKVKFPLSPLLEEKARYVEELLHGYYMQPLSLKELAQKAGTNTEYLRRAFKARTGKTVIEYLTEVRVNKVKEFLKDTHLTLESIAMENGILRWRPPGKGLQAIYRSYANVFQGVQGK